VFTKASTFLGSMTLPSFDIMKPRMVPENTMNGHLGENTLRRTILGKQNVFFKRYVLGVVFL
jgi:hypothetical protein